MWHYLWGNMHVLWVLCVFRTISSNSMNSCTMYLYIRFAFAFANWCKFLRALSNWRAVGWNHASYDIEHRLTNQLIYSNSCEQNLSCYFSAWLASTREIDLVLREFIQISANSHSQIHETNSLSQVVCCQLTQISQCNSTQHNSVCSYTARTNVAVATPHINHRIQMSSACE